MMRKIILETYTQKNGFRSRDIFKNSFCKKAHARNPVMLCREASTLRSVLGAKIKLFTIGVNASHNRTPSYAFLLNAYFMTISLMLFFETLLQN